MNKTDKDPRDFNKVSQNWHYLHNNALDFLKNFTFSLSSMSKHKMHHLKIKFLANGRFENMKSTNLVFWKYIGDQINIFNKNMVLSHYILLGDISISEENIEMIVHNAKDDTTMLMYTDGKQDSHLIDQNSFFTLSDNIIFYSNSDCELYATVMLINDPVSISGEQMIVISFDIRVESPIDFLPKDNFFVIAQHHLQQVTLLDLDFGEHLSINFRNLPSNKWRRVSTKIPVSDNFVSFGLYLESKGELAIKNISLSIL